MPKIKIIGGGYGSAEGLKDRSSAPFYVDDAEAKRLVSIGVAEIVEADPEPEKAPEPDQPEPVKKAPAKKKAPTKKAATKK